MRTGRVLALCGSLIFATLPVASHAGPERALDACVKSFVETYIPKDRVVHIDKQQVPTGPLSVLDGRKGTYTIALSARGKTSGIEFAQARCVTNHRGDVIVLDSPPPDTYVSSADVVAAVIR